LSKHYPAEATKSPTEVNAWLDFKSGQADFQQKINGPTRGAERKTKSPHRLEV
jgi:hypothetical protein